MNDLRFPFRQLLKNPGSRAPVVLTLAPWDSASLSNPRPFRLYPTGRALCIGANPHTIVAASRNDPATVRPKTILAIAGSRFTLNDKPNFLYGISYYGALGA